MTIRQTEINTDLNAVILEAFRDGATMEDVANALEDARSDAPAMLRAATNDAQEREDAR